MHSIFVQSKMYNKTLAEEKSQSLWGTVRILFKAALQRTSIRETKCNMSTFTNDGNAIRLTILREFACL